MDTQQNDRLVSKGIQTFKQKCRFWEGSYTSHSWEEFIGEIVRESKCYYYFRVSRKQYTGFNPPGNGEVKHTEDDDFFYFKRKKDCIEFCQSIDDTDPDDNDGANAPSLSDDTDSKIITNIMRDRAHNGQPAIDLMNMQTPIILDRHFKGTWLEFTALVGTLVLDGTLKTWDRQGVTMYEYQNSTEPRLKSPHITPKGDLECQRGTTNSEGLKPIIEGMRSPNSQKVIGEESRSSDTLTTGGNTPEMLGKNSSDKGQSLKDSKTNGQENTTSSSISQNGTVGEPVKGMTSGKPSIQMNSVMLSIRARNLMAINQLTNRDLFTDYKEIKDFLKIRNCGMDTASELMEYRENLGFLYATRGGNNPIKSCEVLAKELGKKQSDFEVVRLATPTSLDHTHGLFLRCSTMHPMWFKTSEGFEYRHLGHIPNAQDYAFE